MILKRSKFRTWLLLTLLEFISLYDSYWRYRSKEDADPSDYFDSLTYSHSEVDDTPWALYHHWKCVAKPELIGVRYKNLYTALTDTKDCIYLCD